MRTMEIKIAGSGSALAELDDRSPRIARALWEALPIEGRARLWGDEVYFDVPLECDDENASPIAAPGDLSYWSPGPALCIFFGRTQPYSPVNHIGRIYEGLDLFAGIQDGARILVTRL